MRSSITPRWPAPFARVADLGDNTLARLVDECRHLLRRHATRGRKSVYGRAGRPCLVCGSDIMSRRTSRITHYCPSCQK